MHGFFLMLWGGCIFVLAWFTARRYIASGSRALAVGGAIAGSFVLGGVSPFALHDADGGGSPVANAHEPQAVVAVRAPSNSEPDPEVQRLGMCSAAVRVSSFRAGGSVDGMDVVTGDIPVDRGAIPFVEATDRVVLNGWATNVGQTAPARGICAVVDARVVTTADVVYGRARPDVAAAKGNPKLRATGYEVALLGGALPKGKHVLGIAALSTDGKSASIVGSPRPIEVR